MNKRFWTQHKPLKHIGLLLAFLLSLMAIPAAQASLPNAGSLRLIGSDGAVCPLEHTDVAVDISGFIARVTLTQRFNNPYEHPIEAAYTFPMSDRGAVDAMTMTLGDRTITGKIDRKEVARRMYEAARSAGKTASLLDQERPNIFTQSVANIMPGVPIDITISYVEYMKYERGEYEFSFPMVVGPRYIPAGTVDAAKITPPVAPEGTRAGHDISLQVNLNAGVPIQAIASDLHEISMARPDDARAVIALKNHREIPNRDFVLRYAVAGDSVKDALLTHAGEKGNFFSLILQPPERVAPEIITPKELIFVIDRSGSMSGFPIEKAKKTMQMAIEQMNSNDTFNLVSFAGGLGYCFEKPVLNTPENRGQAQRYLQGLSGRGGTEMMAAIRAALADQNDPERLRVVCFMTDGFIGNDMAILDAIQKNRKTARVFAFGIGNGVNRFLIENMAREGRGASEVVTLESDADEAVQRFHERTQSPLLTDIELDFGDLDVRGITPSLAKIPDLFASRPLIVTGRYSKACKGVITLRGNTSTGRFERKLVVDFPDVEPANDVLASLWARERIGELMATDWIGTQKGEPDPQMRNKVTKLGLNFSLVTQFTSFVAVEHCVSNEGGELITIQVPVDLTDGVSHEGALGRHSARKIAVSSSPSIGRLPANSPGYVSGEAVREEVSAVVENEVSLGDRAADVFSEIDQVFKSRDDRDRQPRTAGEVKARGKFDAKLAPQLQGLSSATVDSNYRANGLTVVNHHVELFIRLTDDSTANIDALKRLGLDIVSHARSSKTVYARVHVDLLQRLAALSFVEFVEPAKF